MARITCRTPSTGKPLKIHVANVATTFTTIAEAPDFSVPDAAENFPIRDPADNTRTIKPGEVFFLTPVAARNKSTSEVWIEIILVTETSNTIQIGKVDVPGGDTVFIPLQGRSLLKRDYQSANGDMIQVRAEVADVFDLWVSAEEKLSSEHVGVE